MPPFYLPREFMNACAPGRNASAQELFTIASKFWTPIVVGHIATRGPVFGIVFDPVERSHIAVNGFVLRKYVNDTVVDEYLSFDDLVNLKESGTFQHTNDYVRQGLNQHTSRPWAQYLPEDRYPPFVMFTTPPPSPEPEAEGGYQSE